jgi:hypothetical protein
MFFYFVQQFKNIFKPPNISLWLYKNKLQQAEQWWLMLVIPVTWEAIRRIAI